MWSWTKLSSLQWEDAWSERIAGNPNAVIEKIKGGKTIRITLYCESEEEVIVLKEYFGGSVREVKTHDWVSTQNREKKPPLRIRSKLLVTEQTEPTCINALMTKFPGRAILSIPAEMAFGTGDHATTSTCLRFISDFAHDHRKEDWQITDIGCGTAVLSIAAILLGASHASAFDFDGIAVDVAIKNAKRNGLTPHQIDIFKADVFEWIPESTQKGKLVVANLFSTILQKAFPRIISAMLPEATLIISGILAEQWEDTRTAAKACGLSFPDVIKKGKWVTAKGFLENSISHP